MAETSNSLRARGLVGLLATPGRRSTAGSCESAGIKMHLTRERLSYFQPQFRSGAVGLFGAAADCPHEDFWPMSK